MLPGMSKSGQHMNEDVQLFGGPYPYKPDELVVVTQHRNLVLAELPQGSIGPVRDSDILDLTRIRLKDSRLAARVLRERVQKEVPKLGKPPSAQALDQVLWSLRSLTAARYAGWSPTLGKNRYVGQIHGVGEVNHGGGGDPTPCDPPHTRAMRAAGPGRGVRVGVLDTALYPHPWLAGGWAARFSDRLGEGADLLYSAGHATFVTGLVLEQASEATVDVRRVLMPTGEAATSGQADSWEVAEAIVEFGNSGLDVLNLSFVCYTEDGQAPLVLSTAIDRLPPDLVVVAAAGNHGDVTDSRPSDQGGRDDQAVKAGWPAALDDVIAVGAVTRQGGLAPFCPDAPWIDVLAVGDELISTYLATARPDHGQPTTKFAGWARWSGTSFAAALVSGAIAASTDPGRVSARSALLDILASLDKSSEEPVARTGAKILRLHTA